MKIVTILGARPQFIKAVPVSRQLYRKGITEVVVHTGQHYDRRMSAIFFEELGGAEPAYNLGISNVSHGAMTGLMLEKLEPILQAEAPDRILVYGDTNSTLAGSLAAAMMRIPLAHVEAGLRSFNRSMPEEINRVVTDRLSSLLFVPTGAGMRNLSMEGITRGVHRTGDVMFDAALMFGPLADRISPIRARLRIRPDNYYLATIHRPCNTDDPEQLNRLFRVLVRISRDMPVILPLHPRTSAALKNREAIKKSENLHLIEPVSYLDMMTLEKNARAIITDSGGIQKEAFFHKVPCITLRNETEWQETVDAGWNTLVGSEPDKLISAVRSAKPGRPMDEYGQGNAAEIIADLLADSYSRHFC